jgi:hypothetical protein
MNQNKFDKSDFQRRSIYLFQEGEYISNRIYYNHIVTLYSLNGYFVEVHYEPDSNAIDKIKSVRNEKVLDRYLDNISIPKFI